MVDRGSRCRAGIVCIVIDRREDGRWGVAAQVRSGYSWRSGLGGGIGWGRVEGIRLIRPIAPIRPR